MSKDKLINKYHFFSRVFVLFFFALIVISSLNSAYADLILTDDMDKKWVNDSVENMNISTLRDPTKPLHYVNKKSVITETLTLQAIFSRSNSRSAVINGKHVNVGDVVSNHRVVIIGEKIVSLEKDNKNISLSLRAGMRDVRP